MLESDSDYIHTMGHHMNDDLIIRLPQDQHKPLLPYLNEDHRKVPKNEMIPNGRYLSSQTLNS